MSSQSNSKYCDAVTLKGNKCLKRAIKGEKCCYQHKKKLSSKLIVHTSPTIEFSPIVFSNDLPGINVCCFRNKFGEHVCTEEISIGKFCETHSVKLDKFKSTIHKFSKIALKYKTQHATLDSYVKLLENLTKFLLKYKEYVVNYSLDSTFQVVVSTLTGIIGIYSGDFWFVASPLVVLNEYGIGEYVDKMISMRSKLANLISNVMIRQAKDEIISNNIKINKLSEICLKKSETSNEIVPVICKGLDKHILSFIV